MWAHGQVCRSRAFGKRFGSGGGVVIPCLYVGVFLRASADMLVYAYLPFHFHNHMGETRLWVIGLFVGAPSLVRLAVSPLWGKYADRVGRQRALITGGLLAYAMLLFLLPRYTEPMQVVTVASLMAVLSSAFNPVSRVWLLLSSSGQGLRRLANWHQWEAAGYLVSSVTIGWVVNSGYLDLTEIPLLLCMLLVTSAVVIGLFLPDIPVRSPGWQVEERSKAPVLPHWAYSRISVFPHTALIYLLASSLTWEVVATTFGLYFTGLLGGSIRLYGLLIGTSTFLSVLAYGSLAGFCQRRGHRQVLQIAAWGYTAMYLLMSYPSVSTAGCAYLLPMSSVVRTAMNGLVANQVSERHRGEAMGLVDSVEAGSVAWGAILGGLIAHRQGLAFIPKVAVAGSILLHMLVPRTGKRR